MRSLPGATLAALVTLFVAVLLVAEFLSGFPRRMPDLTVPTIDGRLISLQKLRGRPVLVNFWATTCEVCRREIPQMRAMYRELSPLGFEIVAIAMPYDPPNRVASLAQRLVLPYPVALDIRADAVHAFGGVDATPTNILVSPSGKIVWQATGPVDMKQLRRRIVSLLEPPSAITTRT